MTETGVFMFADDGLHIFPSAEDAAGYMEWVDVEHGGVYEALFTVEGERRASPRGTITACDLSHRVRSNIQSLKSLLRRERHDRGCLYWGPGRPGSGGR